MMSQRIEVIYLCSASTVPPSPSFYALPWISLSCLLSTTALPCTSHTPAPPQAVHWDTSDDAGKGSALQALILEHQEHRLPSTQPKLDFPLGPF